MSDEKHIPFHHGSQYADWVERNCWRCWKYNEEDASKSCLIDQAIGACALLDKPLSDEMARRCGYLRENGTTNDNYTWKCPERESQEERDRNPREIIDHPNQIFMEI